MTAQDVLDDLKANGSESIKRVLVKHGAKEPFYGVKVEYLKKLTKKLKKNHPLALELYATGVSDAMYLAGLIAEPEMFTKPQLQKWLKGAYWYMLSGFTVPWMASSTKFAVELGLEWIESKEEQAASAGWSTLSSYVSITPDSELDLELLKKLIAKGVKAIPAAKNRVKYSINGFVISVGCYVEPLLKEAKAAAKTLGKVEVDMGDTECKVPDALAYIGKVEEMGRIGKKRKTALC